MRKMKVLWLCNIVLPELSDVFGFRKQSVGGWLTGMWEMLKVDNNIELGICVPVRNPKCSKDGMNDSYKFYSFLTISNESTTDIQEQIARFTEILKEYGPDVIHIWGTEYEHTYSMIEAARKLGLLDRIVVNIQGLLEYCSRVYKTGIADDVFYEIDEKGSSMNDDLVLFRNRAIYEKKALSIAKYCIGRTDWDKACVKDFNPNIKYFHCGEILRTEFYDSRKWDVNECRRHSIFISQASYPIKGLHLILNALSYLKDRYDDIEIRIAGSNMLESSSSYGKLIRQEIKKYKLDDSICFIGNLSEEQMIEQYLKANVFISPSLIENSSNSICEAMMLGVPVVASYVGGTPSLISHNKNGFLYPLMESNMMSFFVSEIFDNDKMADEISKHSIKSAEKYNNKNDAVKALMYIYGKVGEHQS